MNEETVSFLNNIDFENTAEVYETISILFEKNQVLKNQQKEFIKWLEEMIKSLFKDEQYGIGATYGYILSKYKEIIGGDNK